LNRFRPGAALALAVAALAVLAPQARGSAEIHKFSLVFSAIPTSISGGSFNDAIDEINKIHLTPRGLESLDKISFGWLFEADAHYFVRPNVAVDVGVGQIHTQTKREFLPALSQDIQLRAELLTVPVHAGLDYYLAPYNQGDFQARMYFGGGAIGAVGNRATFEQVESGTDSSTTLGGNYRTTLIRDTPGYYLEGGVHMFFASKISVMLGVQYRSIVVRGMLNSVTYQPALGPDGKPFTLDVSGLGARMGIGLGF
jgi:Outer membrane protein beta-barrel domain